MNAPSLPAEASTCPFHVPPSNGEVPKRGAFSSSQSPSQLGTQLLETEIETKRREEKQRAHTLTERERERRGVVGNPFMWVLIAQKGVRVQ